MITWLANSDILDLTNSIKEKHHPHLDQARVSVCFNDSKPFKKDKFNWGTVTKFSAMAKTHQVNKYDFCICLSSEAWVGVLNNEQREALLDLHLSCCGVEHLPEIAIVNGKKTPIKDEFGRTVFSEEVKTDQEGNPVYKKLPLDIDVIQENVKRFGCWCKDFIDLKAVMNAS